MSLIRASALVKRQSMRVAAVCQRTFTLSPKGLKHPPKFKEQVLAAYQDRMSLRGSRLVRKAYSFSKHPENHLDAVHFFIATYNLQIKQSTSA